MRGIVVFFTFVTSAPEAMLVLNGGFNNIHYYNFVGGTFTAFVGDVLLHYFVGITTFVGKVLLHYFVGVTIFAGSGGGGGSDMVS